MTKFDTLYKKTSTGAIQQWTTWTDENTIWTEFGQHDGKLQITSDIIKSGKNIGKANETTAAEQATSEATSKWEGKLKKGYVKKKEDAEADKVDTDVIKGGVNPMLAHRFDKHAEKIKFPVMAQPKLDGHRCVAVIKDGKATLWSRTRKPITGVPHIIKELEDKFSDEDAILDGELYNHDYRHKFEELTSFIRQETPKEGHEVVQFWIYDVVTDDDYIDRHDAFVERYVKAYSPDQRIIGPVKERTIIFVHGWLIQQQAAVVVSFNQCIELGYEGLILRNTKGPYKNKRSYDLQKVKEFQDAEFKVTNVIEGRGKLMGKGIFVCETEDGEEFKCKMTGDIDELDKYLEKPEDWTGKMLTVQFQGYTKSNVPRFAVGLRFREDL